MPAKQQHYIEAFSPASISCVFVPLKRANPDRVVSKGVRITLSTGMRVRVQESQRSGQYLAGKRVSVAPLTRALESLGVADLRIELLPDFPFSTGFGMSAAATVAGLLACNECAGLGLTRTELFRIAHRAEVQSGTGIGDVGAQFVGGVTAMFDAENPLALEKLRIKPVALHVCTYGPIKTATILGNKNKRVRIQRAGNKALRSLQALPARTLQKVLACSYQFASESGMLRHQHVISALAEVHEKRGYGSMIMLGNAVVATIPFTGSRPVQIGKRGAELL